MSYCRGATEPVLLRLESIAGHEWYSIFLGNQILQTYCVSIGMLKLINVIGHGYVYMHGGWDLNIRCLWGSKSNIIFKFKPKRLGVPLLQNISFSSVACRICKYVYVHGGFSVEYSTIQVYSEATHRNPSLHHEFLQCRSKYIRMKNDNPRLILRGKDDLKPSRLLELEQTQDIVQEKISTALLETIIFS